MPKFAAPGEGRCAETGQPAASLRARVAAELGILADLTAAFLAVFPQRTMRVDMPLALAAQMAGVSIALASEVGALRRMFLGEVVTQLAFGVLLVHCLWQLARHRDFPLRRPPQ
ncbi:MAG TPA: hypothetical protein VNK24_01380 [Elusimicrobiota bacterium]|nr:hypothetical protein [Elusimicrobiota bacterium]